MVKVLVIRGGAIGDFILTLPALKALRDYYPSIEMHVIGLRCVIELVHRRFYADSIQSIESASLARYFTANAELPQDLNDYFSSFDQIVSFLYDPDDIFKPNLKRAGAPRVLSVNPLVQSDSKVHATEWLAKALSELGVNCTDLQPRLFLHEHEVFQSTTQGHIVFHPGSGSIKKNWPLDQWQQLVESILTKLPCDIFLITGEADTQAVPLVDLLMAAHPTRIRHWHHPPLINLAGLIKSSMVFAGHDSGTTHIANAVGCPVVALFGPTDPAIWGPNGPRVQILRNSFDRVDVSLQSVKTAIGDAYHKSRI
ncbi:MAG: glycosyltransferase family 9 protein [Verrucomicrobiota bacterium]|nr:glycosyltransferase family 9 protein [Verrucomicrobiota bacterium]